MLATGVWALAAPAGLVSHGLYLDRVPDGAAELAAKLDRDAVFAKAWLAFATALAPALGHQFGSLDIVQAGHLGDMIHPGFFGFGGFGHLLAFHFRFLFSSTTFVSMS